MEITTIQKGHPSETLNKRISRINESLSITTGGKENQTKYVIDNIVGNEVYVLKPGKEFHRKTPNINDMFPNVGQLFVKFSFMDIWKTLLNISRKIPLDEYKQLCVIIYRLAYMLDFEDIGGSKYRYRPSQDIINAINNIQLSVSNANIKLPILEFLHFIDILSWNEDVKYHTEERNCKFDMKNPKKGRINTVLSCISVPLIFQCFIDEVISKQNCIQDIDFSLLLDVAQTFARTRGIIPLPNKKLLSYLSPYLE